MSPSEWRGHFNPTDKQREEAARFTALGYRRSSNKYRILTRIDREDWVYKLAVRLRRAPADFYVPGEPNPSGSWCGWYRSCMSSDKFEGVEYEVFRLVPSSNHDSCGYIPLTSDDRKFLARMRVKYNTR